MQADPHPVAEAPWLPVTVTSPAAPRLPLIVSFPHSGETYPADFGYRAELTRDQIDYPNDKYVDELFGAASALGLATVKANFPRTYVDVNRHQHDISAAMLEDPDSWYGRLQPTAEASGSTLFWAQANDVPIYDRKLSQAEAKRRIARYFVPYHQALTRLIEQTRLTFGAVYLLDCHSMMRCDSAARGGAERPQVDIGTRHGQSCAPEIAEALAQSFRAQGYDVGANRRFAGGEITLRYGWPELNQHAVQVELRRDLYMNETTRERSDRFAKMQMHCTEALKSLMDAVARREGIDLGARTLPST